MDAVGQAAEALHRDSCKHYIGPCYGPTGSDRRLARAVLAAVGYDDLVAERDRLRLERDGLSERRWAADRAHANTMDAWAETAAERDRYQGALEQIAASLDKYGAVTGEGHEECVFIARATLDRENPDGV